jgi:RimJ/RimL family protein N-acetyltransferase
VRRADITDALVVQCIRLLIDDCFPPGTLADNARTPKDGVWWLVWRGSEAVAFTGIKESTVYPGNGYIALQGVVPKHRGQQLQLRMIRVAQRYAQSQGWAELITETIHDNARSGNTMIRAGFKMFAPVHPWNNAPVCYWRKVVQ